MLKKLIKRKASKPALKVVGWREWVSLPNLGIQLIKAKVDTGARTSTLHAMQMRRFRAHMKDKLEFVVHPLQRNDTQEILCKANLLDMRTITDSGGKREHRYVIETMLILGKDQYPIELSLTDRSTMGFRMLLGRMAIKNKYLVNPHVSYLMGKKGKHECK